MALNLGQPLQYPTIQPNNVLTSFNQTIAPYVALKEKELGFQAKQQEMARAQAQEQRTATKFGWEQEAKQKQEAAKARLREVWQSNLPQADKLLATQQIALEEGDSKDLEQIQGLMGTYMKQLQAAGDAQGLADFLGKSSQIQANVKMIQARMGEGGPGGTIITPEGEYQLNPYQQATLDQQEKLRQMTLDQQQKQFEMRRQEIAANQAAVAGARADTRAAREEEKALINARRFVANNIVAPQKMAQGYRKAAQAARAKKLDMVSMLMMGMGKATPSGLNENTAENYAVWLEDEASRMEKNANEMAKRGKAHYPGVFDEAMFNMTGDEGTYDMGAPPPEDGAVGAPAPVASPAVLVPGSKEAVAAKLKKAGVGSAPPGVTRVYSGQPVPAGPGRQLTPEEIRMLQEDIRRP